MFISYSQIAFFVSSLEKPFNDWTDRHLQQGFSWRIGSVSFLTLIESGEVVVEFQRNRRSHERKIARAISVPFVCPAKTAVEIAAITESEQFELDAGSYQLIYETGWTGEMCWCCITALKDGDLQPRILICDLELSPIMPLLMEASPAV